MTSPSRLTRFFSLSAIASLTCAAPGIARQTIGCSTGGTGGPFPTSGTGDGVYPNTLPSFPLIQTFNVSTLPSGANVVTEIVLHGMTHTYIGDCQFVLQDPAGTKYNVFCRPGFFSCDYGGDYTINGPCSGGQSLPTACTATLPPGTYEQNFGTWVSGTNSINNTALTAIPAATGTWTLYIYDWAGADVGFLTSWDICFGTAPVAVPGNSTQTAPANGATVPTPVNLTWATTSCALTYSVDIDGVVTSGIAATNFSTSPAPGPHTWRVRGDNGANSGPWTGVWTFNVPVPPPPLNCVTGGGGGAIPTSGTGGGTTWPTTMPPNQLDAPLSVTVPSGSTKIEAVKLHGLVHTWIGDLHFVLEDPTGMLFTVFYRPLSVGGSVGFNCDVNGDYTIYNASGGNMTTTCAPGDYAQAFGDWPSGTNNILNTSLNAITINGASNGTWILHVYDWAGGDVGTLTSWDLCFDIPSGPVAYCTAGTSTNGCVPSISATAQPSVTFAHACNISIANLEGQKFGIVFYGVNNTGFTPTPWAAGSNSFLCVKGPTQRTGTQNSGGTINACNGVLTRDWNAYQMANPGSVGNPFSAGDDVYVQGWYRDPPAPKTTNLSNALHLTMTP